MHLRRIPIKCSVTLPLYRENSMVFYQVPQIYSIKIDTFAPISCINAIYGKAFILYYKISVQSKKIRFVVFEILKKYAIYHTFRSIFFQKNWMGNKICLFCPSYRRTCNGSYNGNIIPYKPLLKLRFYLLFKKCQCIGPSMLPTFNMIGDIVVLEHFSPKLKRLEIGDVVVCISPTNPWRAVCKRILGMVNSLKRILFRYS